MRLITTISALAVLLAATTAEAKCTRLAFSVNDYGKVGPTKDAQAMLDKHIAKWAADNGVKSYTTGKKTVTCELYIDLLVFDEYTCKAEASVCWGEGGSKKVPTEAGAAPAAVAPKRAPPANAPSAPKAKSAQAE